MDRRSFLLGLAGGTVVGGAGVSFLVNSFIAGTVEAATNFVANDGANQPNGGPAFGNAAVYDAGMTWMAWEAWNGTTRVPTVTGYNHSTGFWRDKTVVGISALVDEDHGLPSICLDDEGHLHVFYGNHNTDQRHSSSIEPVADDSARWRVNADISGQYGYPHAVPVGTAIYLFLRKFDTDRYNLFLRKTATLVAGVATWDSEIELVDFGANTRFYMGTAEANGTDIWIMATKGADPDTAREHVYLFVYDTTTGALKNHDGSFSVASGSLPMSLSDANTNCRLFEHTAGNHEGGSPALCFDTNGDPHVLFKDGTGTPTGTFAVKHIMRSAGSWTSPVTVATVTNRFNCPVLVPLSGARVEAWYPLGASRFGNMTRRERDSGGTWGLEINIQTAGSDGLGNPNMVLSGEAEARVIWSECLDVSTDAEAGGLRVYLFGSNGLIPYAAEAEDNSGAADGKQLREDGDDELREDNSFELRETA
jgi:hypothetical protein